VSLPAEEVGAPQVRRTVRVVKAARHLTLVQANPRVDIPPVLMPEAVLPLPTVRPPLAPGKGTSQTGSVPWVAHVLKTPVADFIPA